jgi:hypothetical protein
MAGQHKFRPERRRSEGLDVVISTDSIDITVISAGEDTANPFFGEPRLARIHQ